MNAVELRDIPPWRRPNRCAEENCIETATKTTCDEPEVCSDPLCADLVACDRHAGLLAAMVRSLVAGTYTGSELRLSVKQQY